MGVAGAFGYFMHLVAESLGADVPWSAFAAFCVVVVGLLGYRNVDLSAKVLGTLMVLEFGILLVFNLLVVLEHRASTPSRSSPSARPRSPRARSASR